MAKVDSLVNEKTRAVQERLWANLLLRAESEMHSLWVRRFARFWERVGQWYWQPISSVCMAQEESMKTSVEIKADVLKTLMSSLWASSSAAQFPSKQTTVSRVASPAPGYRAVLLEFIARCKRNLTAGGR